MPKEKGAVTGKELVDIEYIKDIPEAGIIDGFQDTVHENVFAKLEKKGFAIKKGAARPKAKAAEPAAEKK